MIFSETDISGVVVIEAEPAEDDRGTFARTYDRAEFSRRGLMSEIVESSISTNRRAGTLRGLHIQRAPHAEAKTARCVRGALYDVVVDLRRDSPTFGRWVGTRLSADDNLLVHIPEGCAHGFQTLEDDTHIVYDIAVPYAPDAVSGISWDDPSVAVNWPTVPPAIMSARDSAWPQLKDYDFGVGP